MGRFINADAFVSTGQGLLGNNMFAYCLNNPVIYKDISGQAAVILLDENPPSHVGLLAQDEDGRWWHFYWGAKPGLGYLACVLGINVKTVSWCKEYSGNISLTEINNSNQFYGDYENMIYLSGDYSACVPAMKEANGKYNLYTNNCSQVSFRILALANTKHSELFSDAAKIPLPFAAYYYVELQLALEKGIIERYLFCKLEKIPIFNPIGGNKNAALS